jgi:hypothetical protein
MARATLDLTEWDNFYNAIGGVLKEDLPEILEAGATAAVIEYDAIIKNKVPPPVRTRKQPFKTAKQRGWWWATMHAKAKGEKTKALPGWWARYEIVDGKKELVIGGAYKRTGKLTQSLTYRVTKGTGSARAVYGTNYKGARYVIGESDQSRYHKGNWITLEGQLQDNAPEIVRAGADGIMKAIDGRLPK